MNFTPRLHAAIALAAKLHEGQFRKDAEQTPYVSHVYGVMCILSKYTTDEDVLIAGLLHDVLEDVKLPYDEKMKIISDNFGEKVLHIVQGVSEEKDPMEKTDEKETWQDRKNKYLEKLRHERPEVMLVSAADKIHNLISMSQDYEKEGEAIWERFNSPVDKKVWFFEQVAAALQGRLESGIVHELKGEVDKFKSKLR